MRKLLIVAALVLGMAVGWGVVQAQTQTWWMVQTDRGIGITAGTVFPSATSELGMNPADGMLHIDLNSATANPVLYIYSGFTSAWVPVSAISGAGQVPTTLATNAVDVANSIWGGTTSIIGEGATADAVETILSFADQTTGDATFLLPDNAAAADTYPLMFSVLATNALDVANSIWFNTNQIVFEGATADAFETLLVAQDADTADHTFQLPDNNAAADTYNLVFSVLDTNALDVADSIWMDANLLIFEGATENAFEVMITAADTTGDVTITIPSDNATWAGTAAPMLNTTITNAPEVANAVWFAGTGIVVEGATADAAEMTITIAGDPAADITYQFDASFEQNVVLSGEPVAYKGTNPTGTYWAGSGIPMAWRHDFRIHGPANAVCQLDDLSAVCGAADTNVNNVSMGGQMNLEFWVEQAAAGGITALLSPNANGWLVEIDDTADEGIQGMMFGADDDADVGFTCYAQRDHCYFEVQIIVTDSSETDQVLFGWLVRENYSADAEEDGYNTYTLVGIDDAVADPRDIVISEELNGGGGANTDTTVNIVDGTAIRLMVELEEDGTADVWVNGVETNTDVTTFDAGDLAVPYFSIVTSAGDGTPDPDVIITWAEVGLIRSDVP